MVKSRKIPRFILSLVLVGTLLLGSCGVQDTAIAPPTEPVPAESIPVETSPAESTPAEAVPQAPQPVSQTQEALEAEETVKGGSLNSFFPEGGEGYVRVFVQEKSGFSQAKLKQNGEELGLLSINDLANNPKAVDKFGKATESLAGYPLVTVGSTQTAILVGDRYQVKAKSNADTFTPEDRKAWLQKFDLSGLEQLQ